MKRIAITGPAGAGKTTLSNELVSNHGYQLINFTDYLKQIAVTLLAPIKKVSLDDIRADKERYRPFLQAFGDIIDYTNDRCYIDALLHQVDSLYPAVFDNVRSDSQARVVKDAGFKIVKLDVPLIVAEGRGVKLDPKASAHAIEKCISSDLIDLTIDGSLPTSSIASILLQL